MGTLHRRHALALATIIFTLHLISLQVLAQSQERDTLRVEIRPKTQAHPYYAKGYDSCYVIDGVEARELTFVRGRTYVFHIGPMSIDWLFYISRSPLGEGEAEEREGLPRKNNARSGEYLPYTPTAKTPDLVYYQSVFLRWTGWKIHIVDQLSSIDEPTTGQTKRLEARAWIGSDGRTLSVHYVLAHRAELELEIYDAVGRLITDRQLGEREAGERIATVEIPDLSTGFYHYRITDRIAGAVAIGTLHLVR